MTALIAVFGFLFVNTNGTARVSAARCCSSAAPATPRAFIGAWGLDAGFSRHSPPQAGGGANLITRDGAHTRNANSQFSGVAGQPRLPVQPRPAASAGY